MTCVPVAGGGQWAHAELHPRHHHQQHRQPLLPQHLQVRQQIWRVLQLSILLYTIGHQQIFQIFWCYSIHVKINFLQPQSLQLWLEGFLCASEFNIDCFETTLTTFYWPLDKRNSNKIFELLSSARHYPIINVSYCLETDRGLLLLSRPRSWIIVSEHFENDTNILK